MCQMPHPVTLPHERNQPYKTKPDNINLAVDREGNVFWGTQPVPDNATLVDKLKGVATQDPQPEVHIRGDQQAKYESVGKVILAAQRAGIAKVGFITEPPAKGQ